MQASLSISETSLRKYIKLTIFLPACLYDARLETTKVGLLKKISKAVLVTVKSCVILQRALCPE